MIFSRAVRLPGTSPSCGRHRERGARNEQGQPFPRRNDLIESRDARCVGGSFRSTEGD